MNGSIINIYCFELYINIFIGKWSNKARKRPPGEKSWNDGKSRIVTRVYSDLSGCIVVEESIDGVENDTVLMKEFKPCTTVLWVNISKCGQPGKTPKTPEKGPSGTLPQPKLKKYLSFS